MSIPDGNNIQVEPKNAQCQLYLKEIIALRSPVFGDNSGQ